MISLWALGAITTCEILVVAKRTIGINQQGFSNNFTALMMTILCFIWPLFWLFAAYLYNKDKL